MAHGVERRPRRHGGAFFCIPLVATAACASVATPHPRIAFAHVVGAPQDPPAGPPRVEAAPEAAEPPVTDTVERQDEVDVSKEKVQGIEGFNFGLGIGVGFDLHHGERVDDASVDNGRVRVDAESEVSTGLLLETHYFFANGPKKLFGWGPFFAVRTNDDDIVDEAGVGLMFGFRRSNEETRSFNLGFGVMVDPNAKVLADGYEPNEPLPAGATEVRFKEEARFSAAILFSYTF